MELFYWITRFDALHTVFETILISSGILCGILIIILIIGNTELDENVGKSFKLHFSFEEIIGINKVIDNVKIDSIVVFNNNEK